jgi:hypothetical protein
MSTALTGMTTFLDLREKKISRKASSSVPIVADFLFHEKILRTNNLQEFFIFIIKLSVDDEKIQISGIFQVPVFFDVDSIFKPNDLKKKIPNSWTLSSCLQTCEFRFEHGLVGFSRNSAYPLVGNNYSLCEKETSF